MAQKKSAGGSSTEKQIRNKVRAALTELLAENGGCMRITALPTMLIREEFEEEERDLADLELDRFLVTLDDEENPFHKHAEGGKTFICIG